MELQTNFDFLKDEYTLLANLGGSAELLTYTDPVGALVKLRQFGEIFANTLFHEHGLEFPYDNSFHNRLKELEYEGVLPERVKDLLFTIKKKGNIAVHQVKGSTDDAKTLLFSAFKMAKWLCETYSVRRTDLSDVKFKPPVEFDAHKELATLEQNYQNLEAKFNQLLKERDANGITKDKEQEIKVRKQKATNRLSMSEEETREIIDMQLQEAGWEANSTELNFRTHKTLPERGRNMAIAEWPVGNKRADYALFIGTKLYGIVEAKKYAKDISTDLHQSAVYAKLATEIHNCALLGDWDEMKVPFLFATNGRPYLEQLKTKSGIWFLDVRNQSQVPRALKGWYSPAGLQELYNQDTESANKKLRDNPNDFLSNKNGLSLRKYQLKAIQAVEDTLIEQPNINRALLAMATGTGKTRTIMGLCYRLVQTNRFKRILFLVDRNLLGTQAQDRFKDTRIEDLKTFAEIYKISELKNIKPDIDTRMHFATVQSMVKRLFYSDDDTNKPTVDAYDCIIVDEAHRGYLLDREMDDEELTFKDQHEYVSKYRMVLDYFDAFAVGLTATPALHTTQIFGEAVYTYSYREAVIDGYLVDHEPPVKIKTKLSEEGIKWEKGEKPKAYDRETSSIVEMAELEDELAIDVAGFNKKVITKNFNKTVVEQLVNELDPEGEGKTLIFAATDEHADMVVELLKEEFVDIGLELPDAAIQKITGNVHDPQELVKHFKNERFPNIAVTVDLLTTGVDVPTICNLVFLRRIKSRILYEQMIGRATRLCDDIDKKNFLIFDAVRLYESLESYSQMKPVLPNPKTSFKQLVKELDFIDSKERTKQQIEQIIAKFRRKQKLIQDSNLEQFKYLTKDREPEEFADSLKKMSQKADTEGVKKWPGVWQFLDEVKPRPQIQFVSDHPDELLGTERGYGKGLKPEDYLLSFEEYIKENRNKIEAIRMICTRPKDLDRESLRQLRMQLDEAGFNASSLNTAWREAKNEDIAADIISYIRTLALGDSLISHEERIRKAVDKIRNMNKWNAVQRKWIDRFEAQLIKETVLKLEDLNDDPFDKKGGVKKLNKIFNNQLHVIIDKLNEELYTA